MEKNHGTTENDSTDGESSSSTSTNGSRRRVGGVSLAAFESKPARVEAPAERPTLLFSRRLLEEAIADSKSEAAKNHDESHEKDEDDD